MAEYSDVFLWTVIVLAFIGGYGIVSFLASKMKPETPSKREAEPETVTEEQRYARILGVAEPIVPSEVRRAYRNLLAKYHPDKIDHLDEEFKQTAAQKAKELAQAYEYFQRKYGIT
ncbi:MAG TPA: J domain-containing protein [Candidatus Binatia bacterium]|nr:J domain-containing protein [Candidatus Binatia bacterium]